MYYLKSMDTHKTIATFEVFNRNAIKKQIVKYLADNPLDYINYSKFCENKTQHLGMFTNNPVSNQPCKILIMGEREYYKPISITQ